MNSLYATTSKKSITWPAPFETVYQAQRRTGRSQAGRGHRPDINEPLRLLIASAVKLGRDRPHGMITWLGDVLETSRQTIYDIGASWDQPETLEEAKLDRDQSPDSDAYRIERAALTLLVVGAMRLRGVESCLETLIGQGRSLGWLSELVNEAGERAGAVLESADWSAASEMIVARDELFFGETAWLTMVDAKSHAIVRGHVENGVDAETWSVALALAEIQTDHKITGLAEDGGSWYAASIGQAQAMLNSPFRPPVQKDIWHLLNKAHQTLRDAERIAYKRLKVAEQKATWVRKGLMRIFEFDGYEAAHENADKSVEVADSIRIAVSLLVEVLDLVDRRTGAILDHDTAAWYLDEIVLHLRGIDSDLAAALAGTLEKQGPEPLTFHAWLDIGLETWRGAASRHFEDPALAGLFEQAVARRWHLERAITNGRSALRYLKKEVDGLVQSLIQYDPDAKKLAEDLHQTLDGTIRTSSSAENVNSILRAYIWGRRAFRDRRTAQNWFNLLMLWYNLHVFQRGKRAGSSPFELAGVVVHAPGGHPTDNWLDALGYAEAA